MSGLTLDEVVRAPLQEDEETRYTSGTRAFIAGGEVFYYRRSAHYRDWVEIFTHRGQSLGSFRALSQLTDALKAGRERHPLPTSENGRALYRELLPLVGHRIVRIEILEPADCLMPFSVLLLDDGREVIVQSDPEGNDGGFPHVVRPPQKGGEGEGREG